SGASFTKWPYRNRVNPALSAPCAGLHEMKRDQRERKQHDRRFDETKARRHRQHEREEPAIAEHRAPVPSYLGSRRVKRAEHDQRRKKAMRPCAADRDHRTREQDRKSTRLNSSHEESTYADFCMEK